MRTQPPNHISAMVLMVLCGCVLIIAAYAWRLQEVTQQVSDRDSEINQLKTALDAAKTPATEKIEPEEDNSVTALFNPEAQASGKTAEWDKLKKRYEELLVTHYFLNHCTITHPYDFHVIISALAQDMASVNAPGRLQYDILTAARGSYKEMYAKTECTAEITSNLQPSYRQYIDTIAKSYDTH
ncbi:MAG: hypothetical protein SFT92_02220 [Rickettsiales bacterium]|nr:hypothetical protein [Rickettsiales bacterium]